MTFNQPAIAKLDPPRNWRDLRTMRTFIEDISYITDQAVKDIASNPDTPDTDKQNAEQMAASVQELLLRIDQFAFRQAVDFIQSVPEEEDENATESGR